jgi:hypothetical protein
VAEDVVHPRVGFEILVEGFMQSDIHVGNFLREELVMDTGRLIGGGKLAVE